jgi:spore coat polysaccharide biosynthesis protein SpsF
MIDEVRVATTTNSSDDYVAEFCKKMGVQVSRGSEPDVLDRYYQAAGESKADIVVRLTGDCPFIDPDMLDDNINHFLCADPGLDFAANRLPGERTIPIGLDAEICTSAALERAWSEASLPHQREHVMPYFYENPEQFNIAHIKHEPDYGMHRWTVDSPEDLAFLQAICSEIEGDDFSWLEVIELLAARPDLTEINADVVHKTQFDVDKRA